MNEEFEIFGALPKTKKKNNIRESIINIKGNETKKKLVKNQLKKIWYRIWYIFKSFLHIEYFSVFF